MNNNATAPRCVGNLAVPLTTGGLGTITGDRGGTRRAAATVMDKLSRSILTVAIEHRVLVRVALLAVALALAACQPGGDGGGGGDGY